MAKKKDPKATTSSSETEKKVKAGPAPGDAKSDPKTPKKGIGFQPPLPGLEQMSKNDRIHRAALGYKSICTERAAMSVKEKEARDKLMLVMQEEGVDYYAYGNVIAELDKTVKPIVTFKKDKAPAEADADNEEK